MMALDPRIEAIRETYGLAQSDFWQIPQNKQWVCKHSALELVALKANVEWLQPVVIQADTGNGIAVMAVTGKLDKRVEWSTGEASPKNNKNAYPWAMAEKRAKDRVILKLVGLHGLVYSEEEADDFKATPAQAEANEVPQDAALSKAKARSLDQEMPDEISACATVEQLHMLWTSSAFQAERNKLPRDWLTLLIEHRDDTKAALQANPPYIPPNLDSAAA